MYFTPSHIHIVLFTPAAKHYNVNMLFTKVV